MRRSAVDITHVVRAAPPDGRVQIFLNDANIVPHEVPNQMTAMAVFREGQITKGPGTALSYLSVTATGHNLQRIRSKGKFAPRRYLPAANSRTKRAR